ATRGCPRAKRRVARAQRARRRGGADPRAATASARRAGPRGRIQLRAAGLRMSQQSNGIAGTHRFPGRGGPDENLPRIAVVGMSAIMPDAPDLAAFWRNIAGGVDSVREVPPTHWLLSDHYDARPEAPDKTYSDRGAFLPEVDFDPIAFGIPPA